MAQLRFKFYLFSQHQNINQAGILFMVHVCVSNKQTKKNSIYQSLTSLPLWSDTLLLQDIVT